MEKHYFAAASTPLGFRSYFDKLIDGYNLKRLYILKGGSGVGKSTFMQKFATAFKEKNGDCDIDFIHCSNDPDSLDGVIIVSERIGIIDGTYPHVTEPVYPGIVDELINLGEFIIRDKVKGTKKQISELNVRKRLHTQAAVEQLAAARNAHLELEKLYSGAVDFKGTAKVLERILADNNILI